MPTCVDTRGAWGSRPVGFRAGVEGGLGVIDDGEVVQCLIPNCSINRPKRRRVYVQLGETPHRRRREKKQLQTEQGTGSGSGVVERVRTWKLARASGQTPRRPGAALGDVLVLPSGGGSGLARVPARSLPARSLQTRSHVGSAFGISGQELPWRWSGVQPLACPFSPQPLVSTST